MDEHSPVLQALHQGIQTELQGRSLYRKAAEVVQDPKGRQVFASLVHEEEMHLHLLKVQYGALVSEGRWLEMEQAQELQPGQEVETVFPQDDTALADLLPEEGANDLRALELAMQFERTGYQLYEKLAEETDDPKGQEMYAFLAEQEQQHFEFIQRAQEYLQTEGSWYFDEEELPMFEGG
ncbi:MAG: ferritin family protein [Chloroflexia bacterium]|nr:ferritin family protein [Chloroflexia bacterium]